MQRSKAGNKSFGRNAQKTHGLNKYKPARGGIRL